MVPCCLSCAVGLTSATLVGAGHSAIQASNVAWLSPFKPCSLQKKFFPDVYAATHSEHKSSSSAYCTYNNHRMTLITSVLYLTALVGAPLFGKVIRRYGRKVQEIPCSAGLVVPSKHGCLPCPACLLVSEKSDACCPANGMGSLNCLLLLPWTSVVTTTLQYNRLVSDTL